MDLTADANKPSSENQTLNTNKHKTDAASHLFVLKADSLGTVAEAGFFNFKCIVKFNIFSCEFLRAVLCLQL